MAVMGKFLISFTFCVDKEERKLYTKINEHAKLTISIDIFELELFFFPKEGIML